MAKSKDKPAGAFDSVLAEIERKFGDVARDGTAVVDEKRQVIPLSPALDPALSGGIPEGSWVTCSGRYGSGKTTVALRFAANCQTPECGGRSVYFLSIEGRFNRKNALGTAGLRVDRPWLTVVESSADRILSEEDFLNIGSVILNTHPRVLLILDSPSMFAPEASRSGGTDYQNRGGANKLFSEFIRQNSQVVRVQNSVVWSNLHMARSQGMFAGWDEKVAETLNHAADVKIRVKFDKPWKTGSKDNETQIGQVLKWEVDKSALGGPGATVDGYLRYGVGVDDDYERLMLGLELGLVGKSGNWLTMDFSAAEKVNGAEAAWRLLRERPDLAGALRVKLEELTRAN